MIEGGVPWFHPPAAGPILYLCWDTIMGRGGTTMEGTQEGPMCRGTVFSSNIRFIHQNQGKEALREIWNRLQERGIDLDIYVIMDMDWYPLEFRVAFLEILRDLYADNPRFISDLGEHAARDRGLMSLIIPYAVKVEDLFARVASYWKEYYTVGEMRVDHFDPQQHSGRIALEGVPLPHVFCTYLQGYLRGVGMLAKLNGVEVEVEACSLGAEGTSIFNMSWNG